MGERREREEVKNDPPEKIRGKSRSLMATENIAEKTPMKLPITIGHRKYQKCEKRGIIDTLTGDQNVSHPGFDQSASLIVRGCASVPFNVTRIPFLVVEKSVAGLVCFLRVWWGALPLRRLGSFSLLVGRLVLGNLQLFRPPP